MTAQKSISAPGEHRARLLAFLAALCFFLSAVEYMIPKPLPFMRLGIANLPLLLAVDILPFRAFLALAAVKVLGMGLVTGTLLSYVAVFSLAGTLCSALVMFGSRALFRDRITAIGISVLGAVSSNAVQVVLASYFVFGAAAAIIAPVFLAMGLATGLALGVFAQRFTSVSLWYARVRKDARG
ncbi:MAG TPA: Gx transporter family protein [Magnetospirillaceae bacterium]|nr:Gx transporter family protein [Magnetospirillaceae bacterium]